MQQKTKFPWYVAAVSTNEDYHDGPTHCAIELRPSILLMLIWCSLTAWLANRLNNFSEIRFTISRARVLWLSVAENKEDAELANEDGIANVDTIQDVFYENDQSLRGYEIQFSGPKSFALLCCEKWNNTEYYTEGAICISDLFFVLTIADIRAEIVERVNAFVEAHFKKMAAAE